MKRFMENLPSEIIEAARVDVAGPFRLLWSIVLPWKPVVGVVSVFAVLLTCMDYLWPHVVLPDPAIQPLSVRLPLVRDTLQLDVFSPRWPSRPSCRSACSSCSAASSSTATRWAAPQRLSA